MLPTFCYLLLVNIGLAAKTLLRQLRSAEEVSEEEEQLLYNHLSAYMETIASYLYSNLPLEDSFLKSVKWLDPEVLDGSDVVEECALRYVLIVCSLLDNDIKCLLELTRWNNKPSSLFYLLSGSKVNNFKSSFNSHINGIRLL